MKTANRLLLLTLLLAPLAAFAQAQPAPAAYPEWDRLSEAQRAILIEPLRDRWNTKPAERARMLEHAERWRNMPAEKRDRARHGMQRWERMAPEKRAEARALFHAMRGMEAAQRKDFLAQWRQKTPQQRAEWLKEHPAPERREP
ncbi:MAG: DUF3106 domain-containing protein [Lysobacteraceae bacterium]|nr:MAG: DUF3106 domain-containing protein [Xanthomonadaceae bacterium]